MALAGCLTRFYVRGENGPGDFSFHMNAKANWIHSLPAVYLRFGDDKIDPGWTEMKWTYGSGRRLEVKFQAYLPQPPSGGWSGISEEIAVALLVEEQGKQRQEFHVGMLRKDYSPNQVEHDRWSFTRQTGKQTYTGR
jgi:hypothetical protein